MNYPMTSLQRAYYIGRKASDISTKILYSTIVDKDITRFEAALNKVISEQPALRIVFDENYEQRVLTDVPKYKIVTEDISDMLEDKQRAYLDNAFEQAKNTCADPGSWPLFSVRAFRTDSTHSVLFFEIDMMIADGFSIKLFAEEIRRHYDDENLSREENTAFLEYTLHKSEKSKAYEKDMKFWRKKLEDFPDAPVFERPNTKRNISFARKSFRLDAARINEIENEAKAHRTTFASYILSVYARVLSLYSGQTRFTVNLPVFDRTTDSELAAVGDFTSIILLDIDTKAEDIWELSKKVQIGTIEALMHKNVDGTELMEIISKEKGKEKALFPIVFTSMLYKNMQLNMDNFAFEKGFSRTTNVYLDCQASYDNGFINVSWDYDTSAFEENFIDKMFDTFCAYLSGSSSEISVSRSDTEAFEKYNDTHDCSIQSELLTSSLREYAQKHPDSAAVRDSEKTLSYKELYSLASQTANYLTRKGLKKGGKVIVKGYRKAETVAYFLGVLMCGGIYIPTDHAIPSDRLEYIRALCGADVIDISDTDEIKSQSTRFDTNVETSPNDGAYIIFTSGSTGVPKGVLISHKAAMNTISAVNRIFNTTKDDVFLCVSSFGFDLSVYDVFGAIHSGALLVIAENNRDMAELRRIVSQEGVTIWNSVPAIMQLYMDCIEKHGSFSSPGKKKISFDNRETLRAAILSGDYIPPKLPDCIRDEYENCKVYSGGGATEGSVWSIYYEIEHPWDDKRRIPYGYPLPNQTIWILNDSMQLCPIGTVGNICIGGKGVAECYFGDEEKTSASFINHEKYGRLYITGDLGFLSDDGYVEFCGRKDSQVKINGYRVELGEIESVLNAEDNIADSAVVIKKNSLGSQILAAYFTSEYDVDVNRLKQRLRAKLPGYMIPSVIRRIDYIPLTANKKVDKKALTALEDNSPATHKNISEMTGDEIRILNIFTDSTGLTGISPDDDIFELGIDSVKAILFYNKLKLEYNVDLNTIFRYHSIKSLAENITYKDERNTYDAIEQMRRQSGFENDDIQAQKALEAEFLKYVELVNKHTDDIRGRIQKSGSTCEKNVVITGATGFIGAFLVKSIITKTNFHIYALVRGDNCENRLRENLSFYFGTDFTDNYFLDRITVVKGDITEKHLGIDDEMYGFLGKNTDIFYHCAAKVSHYGFYDDFERINVTGTKNALEFCKDSDHASFFLLSSTRILDSGEESAYRLFTEYTSAQSCDSEEFYARSKIEAEKLTEEYRSLGVNASIIRIGTVLCEYDTGVFQRNIGENAFYMVMKAFFKLKMFPAIETEIIDLSYVDYTADAILLLSAFYESQNETFHVFNYDKINEITLFKLLRSAGMSEDAQLLDFDDYYDKVYDMYLAQQNREEIDEILLHAGTYISLNGDLTVTGAEKTRKILSELGFVWPKPTEESMRKLLDYGKKVGYFE